MVVSILLDALILLQFMANTSFIKLHNAVYVPWNKYFKILSLSSFGISILLYLVCEFSSVVTVEAGLLNFTFSRSLFAPKNVCVSLT